MGTDIHGYLEVRDEKTGYWERVNLYRISKCGHRRLRNVEPWPYRNYLMFGILAGLRVMDVEPILPPRGIPDICSDEIREEYEAAESWGIHTPSYYTLNELELAARDKKRYDKDERRLIKALISNIEFMLDASWTFTDSGDNVRFVFWFDS